jgi:hypothetical protein
MRHTLLGMALLALAGHSPLAADTKTPGLRLDARHLKTGRFLYRTLLNGKDAGSSEISIRKAPGSGNFIYTNHVTGQFSQQWEAIATESFAPISAKLPGQCLPSRCWENTFRLSSIVQNAVSFHTCEQWSGYVLMPQSGYCGHPLFGLNFGLPENLGTVNQCNEGILANTMPHNSGWNFPDLHQFVLGP